MDILTSLFVIILFAAALLLTLAVRRDFLAKEQLQRERQRPPRSPSARRKP
jgi:hypothetical protein